MQERLREEARRLLADGEVEVVIGHREGTAPYRVAPAFIENAEHASQLILNELCDINLVNYLPRLKCRAAVVAKGCEARAVQVLVHEQQIKRESVVILGVPCRGIIDRRKLAAVEGLRLADLTAVSRRDGHLVLSAGQDLEVPATDLLRSECLVCRHPTPVTADTMLGDEVAASPAATDRDLQPLTEATDEERLAFFSRGFERCIRCYACVKACPLCYCTTCFAEQERPQWLPRTVGLDENRFFHLGRAIHLAGRCTDCGACDRACPMEVPLRELNAKLAAEALHLFAYESGLDPAAPPPFTTFLPDDTEEAIEGGL